MRRKVKEEMEIKIEMPFAKERQIIPTLTKELQERFDIYPKIVSVALDTLPKASYKSNRFVDNRSVTGKNSSLEFPFWRNLGRKLTRKMVYSFFGGWKGLDVS